MAIHYRLSAADRISHYVTIEMTIDQIEADDVIFELPAWRPGRYELGNFARNIRRWKAFNQSNEPLSYKKISKDSWKVATEGATSIIIRYDYFCFQPDAGACWVDEDQVYINPVHCFFYVQDRLHESCTIELDLPENYVIAGSLTSKSRHVLQAADFHELYDSPFIASDSLQTQKYSVGETDFHIWFQGTCSPGWTRIINDFRAFTLEQFNMMGSFPFTEYHFLIQALPYKFYHGVEHLKSTVLALGPGTELMEELYVDFTGVASHELFHTWNIKTIRPVEMHPYDYKKENYSRLGFVYEGVTTYYGDLFLVRSGVYSIEQFFSEINLRIQKHFDNPGRMNLSVADSSFDTWLDGYNPGVPGRKTSIYDEGCLTALMTDLLIRKKTNSKRSLDDVMRVLYEDFGKKNRGYSEHDYLSIVENVAGDSLTDFFLDCVYGTEEYEKLLTDLLSFAGCDLVKRHSPIVTERDFGFRTQDVNNSTLVNFIYPGSPAQLAGLGKDDEIIAVNETKIQNDLQSHFESYEGGKIVLSVFTPMRRIKDVVLSRGGEEYYSRYAIARKPNAPKESKLFFTSWIRQEFEQVVRTEIS